MTSRVVPGFTAGLCLCFVSPTTSGESTRIDGVVVEFSLARGTLAAPSPGSISPLVFVRGGDGRTNRLLVDTKSRLYFGYSLRAARVGDTRQIEVAIEPIPKEAEEWLRSHEAALFKLYCPRGPDSDCPALSALSPMPLRASQFPPRQVVGDGDTFLFEALVNPGTGDKLVDVIKVSIAAEPSIDESMLRMKDARLTLNGELLSNRAGCEGSVIWFALKDRGRYLFSAKKRDGFDHVAFLRTDTIELTLDGDRFNWVSTEPVIPLSRLPQGTTQLLVPLRVRHEPDWGAVGPAMAAHTYSVGAVRDPDRY